MKSFFRTAILASVLAVAVGAVATPAKAEFVNYDREVVRSAQIRLSQLGYNIGSFNGVTDPMTASALMNFQRLNGIPVSGLLTDSTYDVLFRTAYYNAYTPSYAYAPAASYYPAYTYYQPSYQAAVPVAAYGSYYAVPVVGIR